MSIWLKIFGGNDSGRMEKFSREMSSAAATKGKSLKNEEDDDKPIEVRLASDDEKILDDR